MSVLCIICARGGSKGLENKNIRPINGVPLICYTLDFVNESRNVIDKLVVSTEDAAITQIVENCGVQVVKRPLEYAQDHSDLYDAILYTLDYLERNGGLTFEIIILLTANVPVRRKDLIADSIKAIKNGADSALSVIPIDKFHPDWMLRISDNTIEQYNPENTIFRRQELEPLFIHDGAVCTIKTEVLKKNQGSLKLDQRLGYKVMPIYQHPHETFDIDNLNDFLMAEYFITANNIKCKIWQENKLSMYT